MPNLFRHLISKVCYMMANPSCGILKQVQDDLSKKNVMLSAVEAWWAGLCALPFDKLRVTASLFIAYKTK